MEMKTRAHAQAMTMNNINNNNNQCVSMTTIDTSICNAPKTRTSLGDRSFTIAMLVIGICNKKIIS